MTIRYDDALPILVDLLKNSMPTEFFTNNLIYRDADGRSRHGRA
jgi:hypothetical protein